MTARKPPVCSGWPEDEVDRVYHRMPRDDAWKQVTLGTVVDGKRHLWLYCVSCIKNAYVDPVAFSERYDVPHDTPLLLLSRRIRCTTCGVRTVHAMSEPYCIERDRKPS